MVRLFTMVFQVNPIKSRELGTRVLSRFLLHTCCGDSLYSLFESSTSAGARCSSLTASPGWQLEGILLAALFIISKGGTTHQLLETMLWIKLPALFPEDLDKTGVTHMECSKTKLTSEMESFFKCIISSTLIKQKTL